MIVLTIAMCGFIFLELLNVLLLYKSPQSTKGNAVGIFSAYEKARQDPEIFAFVTYLVNWVAGTKLIFIVLLIGIVITGTPETKVFSSIALIFSILTFFSRLYPTLKKMDKENQLTIKGYSRTLGIMIICFVAVFAVSLSIYLFFLL